MAQPDAHTPRDKQALLRELKVDRSPIPSNRGKSLKWFAVITVAAGALFVILFVDFSDRTVAVSTVLVEAVSSSSLGSAGSSSVLDATGYVVARRQATVSAKTTGKVVRVLIEEGDSVTEGQLLAVLDDTIPRAQFDLTQSQFNAARAGLNETSVAIKQAGLDLNRTRELADKKLASQADLDRDGLDVEALNARLERMRLEVEVAERSLAVQQRMLEDMEIRAPFAGIVVAKAAQPGEMISPVSAGGGFTRTGICTIVDMDSLEVEVDVNEAYINRVAAGQLVQVTLNAYPDDRYPAAVIAIIPTADRSKATVRVRVALLQRDARVLPDMGVRVAFLEEQAPSDPAQESRVVLIPTNALAEDVSGQYVFVVEGQRAVRRAVTTAAAGGSKVRVIRGLAGGEKIVQGLSSEMQVSLQSGAGLNILN